LCTGACPFSIQLSSTALKCRTFSGQPANPAISSPSRQRTWTLDNQGNWDQIASDTSGATASPSDTRTHNKVNDDRASPSGRFAELDARRAPSSGGGAARTYDGNQREIVHDDAGNLSIVELDVYGGTSRWSWKNRAGCV